jgi:hypothetical protein
VVDQRRQVVHRLQAVARGWGWDLAAAVLQEWHQLAWLLPRQQRSDRLAGAWLLRRALWGWRSWQQARRRRRHIGQTMAARWTNLHLALAWRVWRVWVDGRTAKAQTAAAVAARWNNLHLAAAFQAWRELVQVLLRRQAAMHTVAGRWRNLHAAAAFGAWRSFTQTRRQHQAVAAAVGARWSNLYLASAFSSWRQAVADTAARALAADALRSASQTTLLAAAFLEWQQHTQQRQRKAAAALRAQAHACRSATTLLAAAFLEWRQQAGTKVRLRRQASQVSHRQRRLHAALAYGGWREQVAWRASKRAADQHWRQVVLRSLLLLWWRHARTKAGHMQVRAGRACVTCSMRGRECWPRVRQQHMLCCGPARPSQTAAAIRSRTHTQLLSRSTASWRQYVQYRQQRTTADAHACSRLQQRTLLGWAQLVCLARSQAMAAVDMASRVVARLHNRLLFESFTGWRSSARRAAAFNAAVLACSTRRLRACLLAWQQQARVLAGATHMLRRMLVSTLKGAFHEWRLVAQERAHWHRVRG